MRGRNFYAVTSLPTLGELGSVPPLEPAELLEHVSDHPRARELVATIFLGDDLLHREAWQARETPDVCPAVLTPGQVRGEEPLPEYLSGPGEESVPPRIAADAVWAAYYRRAAAAAREEASGFLAAWVAHEVGLRNALAVARARALGLEPQPYLVEPGLGEPAESFEPVVSEWSAAGDPLRGLRVLDRSRWTWLGERDRWFSFEDDELAAYAARLLLLWRWQKIAEQEQQGAGNR